MRPDILEVLAEEITSQPVDRLASFTTWDEGRRKLDGMSRGKCWDIDREQREWERDNAADLARFVARRNWQRWMDADPERARRSARAWVRSNWQRLLAYRARWARAHADRERAYDRRQMAATRSDPVRLARYQAKQDRHRAKKNKRQRDRYWANLEAARARSRAHSAKYYGKRPREGKRRCTLCRKPGHNRVRCKRPRLSL